jgi:cytochrome c-type biogenesis protein CcmH
MVMETRGRFVWQAALCLILLAGLADRDARADEAGDRARRIENQLLAPCCYSESLAVHRSELAARLRAEVRQAVDHGRSDQEILDEYKARYGLRILREPEGERRIWLHAGVVAAVLLGILILVLAMKRLRRPVSAPAPPATNLPSPPEDDLW